MVHGGPGGPHSVEAHLEHVGRTWSAGEECSGPDGVDGSNVSWLMLWVFSGNFQYSHYVIQV